MKNKYPLYNFCALTLVVNAANSFACSDPPCGPTPGPGNSVPVHEQIIGTQILQQSEATLNAVFQQIAN
jgi:hypothetical protein